MCSENAIIAEGISKTYRHYASPMRQLAGALGMKHLGEQLTALAPLSFTIARGESVAIVGRNGSGKSTLLSLIAGTSTPTTGRVTTHGRVVALLELGSGFDPNFSGRDNVYLNGHILGLSRAEIAARFDAIAAFADIGASLDRPVKTYSSGMQMRLAFSVAAHTDADVLIIDESLAVGDAAFVQKCMRFLRRFTERGTLLFVSHDMASVKALCNRAIWLNNGALMHDGDAAEVGDAYLASLYGHIKQQERDDAPAPEQRSAHIHLRKHSPTPDPICAQGFEFNPNSDGFGDGRAELISIALIDAQGQPITHLGGGEQVRLRLCASNPKAEPLEQPILGFFVRDRLGQALFGSNTVARGQERPALLQGQQLCAEFTFIMPRLVSGSYSITAALASGTQAEHTPHDWRHAMLLFDVTASPFNHGIMDLLMDEVAITYERSS